jgi:LEA14-like dessication related protein
MKKLLSLLAPVAALLLVWGGCASVSPSERANLSLVGVNAADSTIFETSIQVTLRVTNETNQPLQLQGSSHKLTLNDAMVGSGVANGILEVPPLGSVTFPVTIRLDNLKLLRRFGGGNIPPEIAYRLQSRLFTPSSAAGLKVVTEGSLDLRPFTNSLMLN